jgi:hypothetical protein
MSDLFARWHRRLQVQLFEMDYQAQLTQSTPRVPVRGRKCCRPCRHARHDDDGYEDDGGFPGHDCVSQIEQGRPHSRLDLRDADARLMERNDEATVQRKNSQMAKSKGV